MGGRVWSISKLWVILLLKEVLTYAGEVVLERLESLGWGGANLKRVGSQLGG